MELSFLGIGSGFNTAKGSTSAYYIEGDKLLLIDCGESTFGKIRKLNLLDGIKDVYFMCTHTHSDHVGSLGSLCLFCAFEADVAFHIIAPEKLQYQLRTLLVIFGCDGCYDMQSLDALKREFEAIDSVNYFETRHCDDLASFCIEFSTADGDILYSGDTKANGQIKKWILQHDKIAHLYLEATTYEGDDRVHLSLSCIDRIVPQELRDRCTLMHFNNSECIRRAKKLGFQMPNCT